jgi:hypothetical protein
MWCFHFQGHHPPSQRHWLFTNREVLTSKTTEQMREPHLTSRSLLTEPVYRKRITQAAHVRTNLFRQDICFRQRIKVLGKKLGHRT